MSNTSDQKGEKKPDPKEQDPVERGKQAIEIQKKTSGKTPKDAEEQEMPKPDDLDPVSWINDNAGIFCQADAKHTRMCRHGLRQSVKSARRIA